MANEFESRESSGGLTLKLYRGEGVALLAFDLDPAHATDDFVGFSAEVKYPGSNHFGALRNRLHFDLPPNIEKPRSFKSTEAPFQKFRWLHVPTQIGGGEFRYRVTAKYMNASGQLRSGAQVQSAISLDPKTIDGFVNVGFTRGFASSQALVFPKRCHVLIEARRRWSPDRRQDAGLVFEPISVTSGSGSKCGVLFSSFSSKSKTIPP